MSTNKFVPYKIAPERFNSGSDYHLYRKWYELEIAPLFENAKEVYGCGLNENSLWSPFKDDCSINQGHSALLIKIQPIKEQTADDLLREMVNRSESCVAGNQTQLGDWIFKAKAYLEKKGVK